MKNKYSDVEYVEIEESTYLVGFNKAWKEFKPYLISEIKYRLWQLLTVFHFKGKYLFGIGFMRWRFKRIGGETKYSFYLKKKNNEGSLSINT